MKIEPANSCVQPRMIQINALISLIVAWVLPVAFVSPALAEQDYEIVTFDKLAPSGMQLNRLWHGLGMDSRMRVYIAIGDDQDLRTGIGNVYLFRYDTRAGKKEYLTSVRDIAKKAGNLKENESMAKVHCEILEHNGKMYFATHDFHNADNPQSHRGGHFMSYDLATGEFEDLSANESKGVSAQHEGIIGIYIPQGSNKLVGWTYPFGNVVVYDLPTNKSLKYQKPDFAGETPSNIAREVIATKTGQVFGMYADFPALYKVDYGLGRLVATNTFFREPVKVIEGMAETADGSKFYLAGVKGRIYAFDVASEKLKYLGVLDKSIDWNFTLALSPDEKKLFAVALNGPGGYKSGDHNVYEFDLGSNKSVKLQKLDMRAGRHTLTSGRGVFDQKGNVYFSTYSYVSRSNYQPGLLRIDVSDRFSVVKPVSSIPPIPSLGCAIVSAFKVFDVNGRIVKQWAAPVRPRDQLLGELDRENGLATPRRTRGFMVALHQNGNSVKVKRVIR